MIKILIVEDEEDILGLLCAIFNGCANYKVFYAKNGHEAINIVRTNNPDIILLDIQLPDMNGYEICRLVKSDTAMSHIKVVMLSGMTQNSDWLIAREAGADGYITKPFSSIALIKKLEQQLRSNQEK